MRPPLYEVVRASHRRVPKRVRPASPKRERGEDPDQERRDSDATIEKMDMGRKRLKRRDSRFTKGTFYAKCTRGLHLGYDGRVRRERTGEPAALAKKDEKRETENARAEYKGSGNMPLEERASGKGRNAGGKRDH